MTRVYIFSTICIAFFYLGFRFIKWIRNKVKRPEKPKYKPSVRTVDFPELYQAAPDLEGERQRDKWVSEQTDILLLYDSVLDLIKKKKVLEIGYSDLLNCIEWKFMRLSILSRDCFKCQDCGLKDSSLHVHHLYYLKGNLPWEIENSALVSLCFKCHKNRHDQEKIPVYEINNNDLIPTTNHNIYCSRCNGSGHFPQFNHVENGICFRCRGNCLDSTIFSQAIENLKSGMNAYNTDVLLDSITNFFSSITVEDFKSKIAPAHKTRLGGSNSATSGNRISDRPSTAESIDNDLPF